MANYLQQLEQLGVPPLKDNPTERAWDGMLKHRLSHILETILPDGPYDFLNGYQLHAIALACGEDVGSLRRILDYPGVESPELVLNHIVHVVAMCLREAWMRKHKNNPDAPRGIPMNIEGQVRTGLPYFLLSRSIRADLKYDRTVREGSIGEEECKKEQILGRDPVDVLIERIRAKSQEAVQ